MALSDEQLMLLEQLSYTNDIEQLRRLQRW